MPWCTPALSIYYLCSCLIFYHVLSFSLSHTLAHGPLREGADPRWVPRAWHTAVLNNAVTLAVEENYGWDRSQGKCRRQEGSIAIWEDSGPPKPL